MTGDIRAKIEAMADELVEAIRDSFDVDWRAEHSRPGIVRVLTAALDAEQREVRALPGSAMQITNSRFGRDAEQARDHG